MNKATLTLALAALTVASASAGDIFVKEFPPQLPPQLTPKTAKQHRAPLNQEKNAETKCSATQWSTTQECSQAM